MGIYWTISLHFREILFCEHQIFENDLNCDHLCFFILQVHFKLMEMGIAAFNPVQDLCY